jgi:hypothetical protein
MPAQNLRPISIEELGRFSVGEQDHALYLDGEKVLTSTALSLTRAQVGWAIAAALAAIVGALASATYTTVYVWTTFHKTAATSSHTAIVTGVPVYPEIVGCVGPFVAGKSDALDKPTPSLGLSSAGCTDVEAIKQAIDSRKVSPTLLAFVGSADKFPPTLRLRRKYGSNDGLAQARADWVMRQLGLNSAAGDTNKLKALSFVRGPRIYEMGADMTSSASDRSVAVYGFWSQEPLPASPVK